MFQEMTFSFIGFVGSAKTVASERQSDLKTQANPLIRRIPNLDSAGKMPLARH